MIDLTSNRISHVMSAEQLAAAKTALQQLTDQLNFLVYLGPKEMQSLYNVSDADKTFIRNGITEMKKAGNILPAYVKIEEIEKDLACGDQLLEMEHMVMELLGHIRRNRRLANSEAYSGVSVFYKLVGAASRSGSAAAQAIYERLQEHHVNKKKGGRASGVVRGNQKNETEATV